MSSISDRYAAAMAQMQVGRFSAAATLCREILAREPRHADATHLLGVAIGAEGDHATATEYMALSIELAPRKARFHANLGMAHEKLGNHREAIECLRRALDLDPKRAATHYELGKSLYNDGQLAEALACFHEVLRLQPDLPQAHNEIGNVLADQERTDEAIDYYRRAIALAPNFGEAHNNLAVALHKKGETAAAIDAWKMAATLIPLRGEIHHNLANSLMGRNQHAEAIACYRKAIELKPDCAEAHAGLGNALLLEGRRVEATDCWRRAAELKPDDVDVLTSLANALGDLERYQEAVPLWHRIIALQPENVAARINVSVCYKEGGRLADAIACCDKIIETNGELFHPHCNKGNALKLQARLREAVACYRRALELCPDDPMVHSNLLQSLHYDPNIGLRQLHEAHLEYDRRHAAPLRAARRAHDNPRDPDRPLRLGFVSGDFLRHPAAGFLLPAMERLDRQQCAIVCYSSRPAADDFTARFQALANLWRNIDRQTAEELAHQIREDRIDILFDLTGHTARDRLMTFAREPAPIQITWIGYEGTTGLAAMDYLLGDRFVTPDSAQPFCSETIARLPHSYVCLEPPEAAPEVGPLPALRQGYPTFGSFNNPAKFNAEVVGLWAEILRRVPDARMVLKYKVLGDESVQRWFVDQFAEAGVAPHRLELLPASSYAEYLAAYQRIDVALDPFPFSGGATTCDALWMGVPVLTWPWETFASRHALSFLSTIGLLEYVAESADDYVARAVSAVGDLPRLAAVRAGLRERMVQSPLCDGKQFAADLLALLRDLWQRWVGQTG